MEEKDKDQASEDGLPYAGNLVNENSLLHISMGFLNTILCKGCILVFFLKMILNFNVVWFVEKCSNIYLLYLTKYSKI